MKSGQAWSLLMIISLISGCESSRGAKIEHPVIGPPPPRVSAKDLINDTRNYAQIREKTNETTGDIMPANATVSTPDNTQSAFGIDTEVVAYVNGKPIIAADVLEPYTPQLRMMQSKVTPEEYQQQRNKLIEQDLNGSIERTLLVSHLTETMKKDQVEAIDKQLDKLFDEQMKEMMNKTGKSNAQELDELLRQQGSSVQQLRRAFGNQQLAMFYLQQQVDKPRVVGRPELLEYYESHKQEFHTPARSKWMEISVSYEKNGGKVGAARIIKNAISDLRTNVSFEEVAKKYSDGATSSLGGVWDWTQYESLADPQVADMIFKMPINELSSVYEGATSFKIIKVTEREEDHYSPFEKEQDRIRKKIIGHERELAVTKVLQDLKASADIQTNYKLKQNDKFQKL